MVCLFFSEAFVLSDKRYFTVILITLLSNNTKSVLCQHNVFFNICRSTTWVPLDIPYEYKHLSCITILKNDHQCGYVHTF